VLDVLEVLDVVAVVVGGGVSAFPSVGMFPAKIVVESAHMSVSAIANCFMGVAPFESNVYVDSLLSGFVLLTPPALPIEPMVF